MRHEDEGTPAETKAQNTPADAPETASTGDASPEDPEPEPEPDPSPDSSPDSAPDSSSPTPEIGEHRAPDSHLGLLDVEEQVSKVVLGEDDVTAGAPLPISTFAKLLSALATFAALVAASYLIPLEWAQPWRAGEDYVPYWNVIGRELMGQGAAADADADAAAHMAALAERAVDEVVDPVAEREVVDPPPDSEGGARYPDYAAHALDPDPAELERAIENPAALAPFYEALTRTDLGYAGALTRVGHWGDSVLGNDGITSAIRRRMQARFGDAGHGFHALERYDASYRHQNVRFESAGAGPWELCFIRNRCMKTDGRYGYGGVTVWSTGGAASEFETPSKGPVGLRISDFELWFMRRDKGGKLRVRIDGGPDRGGSEVVVDTALSEAQLAQGLEKVDAWERIELEDGPHRVEVRAGGGGLVRAYGVVLEREGPGVVWDGMALIGAFTKRLGEFDDAHLHDQLEHRGLDLMVFTFGGNDMTRADLRETMDPYVEDYAAVIRRFRQARPAAACLIMGPVDHGERVGGRVVSREIVARMTTAQREVALAEGCAFFDTLAAMGGDGAVARWKSESLMSGDLSHPSFKGHALLGAMVYRALMAGYVDFRRAQAGQPMTTQPEPAQPD